MKIALVSDTHDHVDHIGRFTDKIRKMGIETVIHAGDYCSPFTIPLFSGFNLIGVFGNNDGDHFRLVQKFREIECEIHNEFHEREVDGRKIAVYHGTQPAITEALERCGKYDLVISGHTHAAGLRESGETISVNPGSLHGFDGKATFATYDTQTHEIKILEL